jgi:hypothetical protein
LRKDPCDLLNAQVMYVYHTARKFLCTYRAISSVYQASSILIINSRFGGTDCQYHYNDTWVFDTNTATWSELTCIGYTPSPREGHAAALVDDVMYVFGGRGVDGKDLGDLGAFKLSSASSSNSNLN